MNRGYQAPKDLKKSSYCLGFNLAFATDLITEKGSHAVFKEILYTDGTLIQNYATGWTGYHCSLEPLVVSRPFEPA